jgi:hypothetical protein
MGVYMSTLTQFTGGGDSYLGEYVPNWAGVAPFGFSAGTREYVRTGFLKAYSADYAAFAASNLLSTHNTPTRFLHPDWQFPNYGGHWNYSGSFNYPKMFTQGTDAPSGLPYKHILYLGGHYSGYAYPMHRYGLNFANTPVGSTGADWGAIWSADKISNRLVLAGYMPSLDTGATGNYYGFVNTNANSPTFNTSFFAQSTYADPIYGCENAVASQLYTHENYSHPSWGESVYYTNNGTSITKRSPSIDLRYMRRMTWSQMGNCFILVKNDGKIYTTVDGSSFNLIGTSNITGTMPTSIGDGPIGQFSIDHPTNGTMIILGGYPANTSGVTTAGLYVLKTTNGTTFTVENIAANTSVFDGHFAGVSSNPRWFNTGTHLIMWTQDLSFNGIFYYSTNYGVTWTQDRRVWNTLDGRTAFRGFAFYDNALYGLMCPREGYGDGTGEIFSFANRRFGATPQFIGTASGLAWAGNSSMSVYERVK